MKPNKLTYAEVHATVLGLAVGGVAALTGFYALAGIFALGALGVRYSSSKALKEVKKEPWYALAGLAVSMLAGVVIL